MKMILGGDLCPTRSNFELFSNADIGLLLGADLLEEWSSADLRIFNLETPLTDRTDPIVKSGPHLMAPTSTIKGIKALNPSVVSLANNHILDHGAQGLLSTTSLLKDHGIPFVGVGEDLSQASEPYILDAGNIRIGIYACAEHEFTIAGKNSPGANPFDPLESLDHISDLSSKCDHVIVLYHGGKEHFPYPSPHLQRSCRKMVEKGADLVVTQHSHCVGSLEEYLGGTIVYGQGNFIFNGPGGESWGTGLLLGISLGGGIRVEYIPVIQRGNGVRLADGIERQRILGDLRNRSLDIMEDGFIEKQYRDLARKEIKSYLRQFSGKSRFRSRVSDFMRWLMNGDIKEMQRLSGVLNSIRCEAHRELVKEGLKEKISRICQKHIS